jgi:sarcosine oxidase subunit beta
VTNDFTLVSDGLWCIPMVSGDDEGVETAEVVIVGGGVMGASIAFHLAAAGITDVLLLEADELASGSSGKPIGGVRAQFSSPANVQLGARSLVAYRNFEDDFGVDIGLERVGYLFLLRDPADVAAFEASVAMQNELGVPSRMITPAEAAELNPYLDVTGVIAAAYSPEDGYARPGAVVRAYAAAATKLGVRIRTESPVVGVDVEAGEIVAVLTAEERIAARTVICTAGAWSGQVGAMVGVELPVEPVRRQIVFTPALTPRPPRIPFTIDFDSSFYFHTADDGLLLGFAEPEQPVGFATDYDESWLPSLRALTARCAPDLTDVAMERGWAGLYEMTPDCNALIGRSSTVNRFLYAAGFSGHGFLQAPAVGEIVRDLYLGVSPFCDVSGFDAQRFAAAAPLSEHNVI